MYIKQTSGTGEFWTHDYDGPLKRAQPTGGWVGREPREYYVRAKHAEDALTLVAYCDHMLAGKISAKYAGRVARSEAELADAPELRTFHVLTGSKPSSRTGSKRGEKEMASEIREVTEPAAAPEPPERQVA